MENIVKKGERVRTFYLGKKTETDLVKYNDKYYVVKVMKARRQRERSRIDRQRRALLMMEDCPYSVNLVYYTSATNFCINCTEYIDGWNAKQYMLMMKSKRFTERQCVPILKEVLRLIKSSHENDIALDDLSLYRVYLRSNGHVCYSDFRTAKVADMQPFNKIAKQKQRDLKNFGNLVVSLLKGKETEIKPFKPFHIDGTSSRLDKLIEYFANTKEEDLTMEDIVREYFKNEKFGEKVKPIFIPAEQKYFNDEMEKYNIDGEDVFLYKRGNYVHTY